MLNSGLKKTRGILFSFAVISMIFTSYAERIQIYVVNPLEKVFKDTIPEDDRPMVLKLECAANEYESAQFVIRSDAELKDVTVKISALTNKESGVEIAPDNIQWHFLGYVPVERNTSEAECGEHEYIPEGEFIRLAPFDCPDPLLEERRLTIEANQSQPVWITVYVSSGIPPAIYSGEVTITTSDGKEILPIELTVYPFELPDEKHLHITNWFETVHIAQAHEVEEFGEAFWKILERFAKNLAQHRQNVVFTPWHIIQAYREANGELSFDYTDFDRFVETFFKAGVNDRIELWHVARHGKGGRVGTEIILKKVEPIDRKTGEKITLPGNQGLAALLEDLRHHLEVKGWLDKTIIHVADEPSFHNIEQWKEASRFVREHIPGIKTIDAIGGTGFEDMLNIMVPLSLDLNSWFDDYKKAQASGAELWFYTCCVPYGYYANRFLDYHLSKTRILHWMNFSTGTEGFLHWGLTYGWEDPFGPAPRFPPGDSHIIYPGKDGPLSSIRWEMMREGLEDYEYLWLLESKTKQILEKLDVDEKRFPADFLSREICGKLVKSLTEYTTDPETFYSVRRLLAKEISCIDQSPLILLATDPWTNTELVTGPPVTKVYGFVEKGTKVTINGKEAIINPVDGFFLKEVSLSLSNNVVEVMAELNGKKKMLKREFKIK